MYDRMVFFDKYNFQNYQVTLVVKLEKICRTINCKD